MIELKKLRLADIMPANLMRDENVKEVAEAIDAQLNGIAQGIDLIRILSRFDSLPESFIGLLAWQYHVDFYDESLTLEKKRNLVKIAIATHRVKGTKKAVENVVSAAFDTAKVEEWFDYGGEPYHFRVLVDIDESPDAATIVSAQRAIDSVKNVRSWLDDLRLSTPPMEAGIYMGVADAFDISASEIKEAQITTVTLPAAHYHVAAVIDVSASGLREKAYKEKAIPMVAYRGAACAWDISETSLKAI